MNFSTAAAGTPTATGSSPASGGLGPTVDDITREGLAAALGVELEFDPEILSHIESLFERRGRRMPPSNRRQAMRTPQSRVIPNPVGSAVGLFDTCNGTPVALLPGVPAELKSMFEASVRKEFAPLLTGTAPLARRLRTSQVAESALVELVDAASSDLGELDLAYCVSTWGVDLLVRGSDRAILDRQVEILLEALGDRVFAEGDPSLPAAVIGRLRQGSQTVAVAESCTGGLLGGALSSVPGCSAVLRGGVIAYDGLGSFDDRDCRSGRGHPGKAGRHGVHRPGRSGRRSRGPDDSSRRGSGSHPALDCRRGPGCVATEKNRESLTRFSGQPCRGKPELYTLHDSGFDECGPGF